VARTTIVAPAIRGIVTAVPQRRVRNLADDSAIPPDEVRKVVALAGVVERPVADENTCSTDLCASAAEELLATLGWPPSSVDALIMATQTPDYIMPSSACLLQDRLGLPSTCAAFDVGLGCSGYVYGMWLASTLLAAGNLKRVLLVNGETPTKYADPADRSVSLLFGDAGSATALEAVPSTTEHWHFSLHSDGAGAQDLIVKAGGFRNRFCADRRAHSVVMDGARIFNFTLKVVPPLIAEMLEMAGLDVSGPDLFVFHQSNRFIINHLVSKCGLPPAKAPIILPRFGNTGGPSIPLTITQSVAPVREQVLRLMLIGYGVGLSWAGAVISLPSDAVLGHVERASGNQAVAM